MDISDYYIMEVYNQRSITKAAKILNISQPALSSAVLSTENKLGYTLFNRKTSPLSITQEGVAYYSFLCKKKILEKNLELEINDIHNPSNINITIGAPSAYIPSHVIPCINEFVIKHPYSNIRIVEGTVLYLSQEAKLGNIDFYISSTADDSEAFSLERISSENVFLCANKEIPLTASGEPDFNKLSDYSFIMLCQKQPLQQQIDNYLNSIGFKPAHIIEVDQVTSGVQLAILGSCICFATTSALANIPYDINLNTVKLPDRFFNRSIYLSTLSHRYITSAQREFMDLILENGGTLNEKI